MLYDAPFDMVLKKIGKTWPFLVHVSTTSNDKTTIFKDLWGPSKCSQHNRPAAYLAKGHMHPT